MLATTMTARWQMAVLKGLFGYQVPGQNPGSAPDLPHRQESVYCHFVHT